jgi:hypothetical protein
MTGWPIDGERADPGDPFARQGLERHEDDEATTERLEVEWAATSWHSLLLGARGHPVALTVSTGGAVEGMVSDVGDSWCLVDVGGGSVVVVLAHVVSMQAAPRAVPPRTLEPTLGSVMRRWARMRSPVSLQLSDGRVVAGQVRHVLADAVTVAASRASVVAVPYTALVTARGPRLVNED